MTNIVLLSLTLSTNWTGFVTLRNPLPNLAGFLESEECGLVFQTASLGTMNGTNCVWIGDLPKILIGHVRRTNGSAAGCIEPYKKD